jgi:hypothetical protein
MGTAAVPVRDDSNVVVVVVVVVWITNQEKIHFHCVDVNWQSMPLVSDKFFFFFSYTINRILKYIYIFFRFLFVKRKWTLKNTVLVTSGILLVSLHQ